MSNVKVEPFFFGSDEDDIQINPQDLPGATKEEEKKEEKQEAKPVVKEKQDPSTIEDTKETKEEDDDFLDPLNLFSKNQKPDKGDKKEEKSEKLSSDKIDYKAFADFLIETEVWKDFEGREDLEINEETFQTLWKAQAENKAKEFINEEREQFGAANELIDFLKAGGTLEQYTANYNQQVDIESIDIAEEDGQEKVVKEYYESIGWKPEKIKKHLERLKDETELKEEAEDCKSKLVDALKEEREAMLKEQEAIAEDRKIRSQKFNQAVREAIYKNSDLADREKKELDKFVYEYKYHDNQGRKYSEFAVKMGEINNDPIKYAKFINFIKNIDSFEDKKLTEKKEAKKNFNFLKTGANPLAGAESIEPTKKKVEGSPPAFKFK